MGTMLVPSIVNAKEAGKKQQSRWSIIECLVGEPNPVTSYKTLKKAEKVAGFSFHIPVIKNYRRTEINLLDKEVFEITYKNKKKKVLNATWYDKGYSYAIVPYKTLTKKGLFR